MDVPPVQSDPTGRTTTSISTHETIRPTYSVSKHAISRAKRGSLVDRGANGGILGSDAHVRVKHPRKVDVTGIDNHELNSLPIVDASAKILTDQGPAIAILQNYAYFGRLRTIHSAGQIEHYGATVDDRSMRVGGRQCITTKEGYVIPLDIINGLPYLQMEPHSSREFEDLPHIILTGPDDWDPRKLDNMLSDRDDT